MHRIFTLVSAVALTLGTAVAKAADFKDMFSFRGFGTLGMVHSSEDRADFRGSVFQPDGAGFTRDWDQRTDTRLAVQLSAKFTDKLTAVVQVLSQYQHDRTFTPQIEWANLKYQATPELSVRVGRIALPTFFVSETRLVGYANPWARPPQEVYFVSAITSNDGVDVSYTKAFGRLTNTVQVFYGTSEADLPAGDVESDPSWGVNWTAQVGDGSVRIGYIKSKFDFNIPSTVPLFSGIKSFGNVLTSLGLTAEGSAAQAMAKRYDLKGNEIGFLSLGGTYDPGQWFVIAEAVKFYGDSLLSDAKAGYATGGYRIGKFTPYATVARLDSDIPFESGIPTARLGGVLLATARALNAGVNTSLNNFSGSQDSASVGVRWDFMDNVAFKAQYDRLSIGDNSNGRLANTKPALGYKTGSEVDVISFVVDFVF
jgi:hypothetical protein